MQSIVDDIVYGDIVDKAVEADNSAETVPQTEFCDVCNNICRKWVWLF